jgi:hypothetical protein
MWRNMTEQEEAEKKYLDRQATLRTEFYSKCDGNFAGVIHWSERYPPVPAVGKREMVRIPKFHEDSTYEPTKECSYCTPEKGTGSTASTYIREVGY